MRASAVSTTIFLALACLAVAQERTAETATRGEQLRRARGYIQAGRHYEASRIAKDLLELNANDAEAQALLDQSGRELRALHQQKVDAARAAASRAGATDADRRALADVYYDAGEYDAARGIYVGLPPGEMTPESRLRHARSLAWTSHYDDAERIYDELLREQSTPELRLEYGRLLSWMGATAASIRALDDVYRTNPSEDAVIALANARAWSGDRTTAIVLLTDFTAAHPEATEAQQLLNEMQDSPELRLERASRLIDSEPYNLALRVERARLLYDAGRYAGALREIEFIRKYSKQSIDGLDELEQLASTRRE